MELGEVGEDLLERGTGQSEFRDETLILQVVQDSEDSAQFEYVARRLFKRPYFVIDFT